VRTASGRCSAAPGWAPTAWVWFNNGRHIDRSQIALTAHDVAENTGSHAAGYGGQYAVRYCQGMLAAAVSHDCELASSSGPLSLTHTPANLAHPMQGKHAYGATGIASSSATMPTSVLSPSMRPQTAPAPAMDGKAYASLPSAMPPAATEGAPAAAVADGAPMDEKTCVAGGSSSCAWPLSYRGAASSQHCPATTPQVI
jgi:hypothetical protein